MKQLNPGIAPLETRYAGYRFRSRIEARWAVFRDAFGSGTPAAPTQNGTPPPASKTPPPAATAPQGSSTEKTPRPPPRKPWLNQGDVERDAEVEAAIQEATAIAARAG